MAKRPTKPRDGVAEAAVRIVEAITGVHLKPKAPIEKPPRKKRVKRASASRRSRTRR